MEDEAWQTAVRNFARAILHGDDVHREWLLEAAEAFVSGERLPPPRSASDDGTPVSPTAEVA